MLQGKRFGSNEKVIAETEAYFKSKDESFYNKGIEKLEKRLWLKRISFEEKFILFKQIFIWLKDILFEFNKYYIIHVNLLFASKNHLKQIIFVHLI